MTKNIAMMLALLVIVVVATAGATFAATGSDPGTYAGAAITNTIETSANTDVGATLNLQLNTKNWNEAANPNAIETNTAPIGPSALNGNATNQNSAMATAGKGVTTGANTWKVPTGNTAVAHVANAVNNIPVSAAFGGFITS